MSETKRTVLVDFDGVIHRYSRGWDDGTAYDVPMPGAFNALINLMEKYRVVIFSTRDANQISEWLVKQRFPRQIEITNVKIPAIAIIDDRAIRFEKWDKALDELEKSTN